MSKLKDLQKLTEGPRRGASRAFNAVAITISGLLRYDGPLEQTLCAAVEVLEVVYGELLEVSAGQAISPFDEVDLELEILAVLSRFELHGEAHIQDVVWTAFRVPMMLVLHQETVARQKERRSIGGVLQPSLAQ